MKYIDVSISKAYPANVLSNMAANAFIFDGVQCASMEGLLQAFKFPDCAKQLVLCTLTELDAKYAGKAGDGWRKTQMLHWDGVAYPRASIEYQNLLDKAYHALATNNEFQKALLATGSATLTHNVGKDDPHYTILTRREFIDRLLAHRIALQQRRST